MNSVIHFWLISGKVGELQSRNIREKQGTLLKKLGGNPEVTLVLSGNLVGICYTPEIFVLDVANLLKYYNIVLNQRSWWDFFQICKKHWFWEIILYFFPLFKPLVNPIPAKQRDQLISLSDLGNSFLPKENIYQKWYLASLVKLQRCSLNKKL